MAVNDGHLRLVGVVLLVLVGVALGIFLGWAYSTTVGPLIAAIFGGVKAPKAPDLESVESQAKAQILAESPGAVVASLDPDTRTGIANAVDDAISEAQQLSDAHKSDPAGTP